MKKLLTRKLLNSSQSRRPSIRQSTTTLLSKYDFDPAKYDYVAVFIGADYCPHCKAFAPTVKAAVSVLEQRKCKVLFLSNDRTEEAFQASCKKNVGIDVLPYNLEKTRAVRDLFELKTIPALMILKNQDFQKQYPTVVTNARSTLDADPEAKFFPWVSEEPMSFMDRFIIRGKYGNWWELGHHVNPDFRKYPCRLFFAYVRGSIKHSPANPSFQRIKSIWMNMPFELELVSSTL